MLSEEICSTEKQTWAGKQRLTVQPAFSEASPRVMSIVQHSARQIS